MNRDHDPKARTLVIEDRQIDPFLKGAPMTYVLKLYETVVIRYFRVELKDE